MLWEMPLSVKGTIQLTQDLLLLYFHLWEDVLKLGFCLKIRWRNKSQPYLADLLQVKKTTIPFMSLNKFSLYTNLLSGILVSSAVNFQVGKFVTKSQTKVIFMFEVIIFVNICVPLAIVTFPVSRYFCLF